MGNLTIRMNPQEKRELAAWAETKGASITNCIKQLIAEDMAAGSARDRAAAWLRENATALTVEARAIDANGIPGADVALNYPHELE